MSWESEFLANLESINTALGGSPIVLPEPRSFESDSLLMLSAIGLAAAGGGGGGGGQRLFTTKTDVFTLTTPSIWADVTGLTLTVTPTTATKKIRVLAVVKGGSSGNGFLRLVRGATPIAVGDAAGSRTQATSTDVADFYARLDKTLLWIDEPATTLPVTYKVQALTISGILRIGATGYSDSNSNTLGRVPQFFELQEID